LDGGEIEWRISSSAETVEFADEDLKEVHGGMTEIGGTFK